MQVGPEFLELGTLGDFSMCKMVFRSRYLVWRQGSTVQMWREKEDIAWFQPLEIDYSFATYERLCNSNSFKCNAILWHFYVMGRDSP